MKKTVYWLPKIGILAILSALFMAASAAFRIGWVCGLGSEGDITKGLLWFQIVLPLSTAVLAVITLYYGVGNWNNYFEHMIYLRDRELMPLSIIVRDILLSASINLEEIEDPELLQQMTGVTDVIKYCTIVVTSGPIIAAYPFVQKYFKKGVMIGSIKG